MGLKGDNHILPRAGPRGFCGAGNSGKVDYGELGRGEFDEIHDAVCGAAGVGGWERLELAVGHVQEWGSSVGLGEFDTSINVNQCLTYHMTPTEL